MNINSLTRCITATMMAILWGTATMFAPAATSQQVDGANDNRMQLAETPESDAHANADKPIKIGYVIPLSGAAQGAGQQIVNGMKLYLDQIHHQMAGRKIEVIIENDGTSPVTAVDKARKLVEHDKVNMISGIYMTNALYAIAPV